MKTDNDLTKKTNKDNNDNNELNLPEIKVNLEKSNSQEKKPQKVVASSSGNNVDTEKSKSTNISNKPQIVVTKNPFQDQDQNIGQARLVELLGEVMGTSETGGTSPIKVLNGLRIYLENKKVKYRRLASTGWRSVPDFVYVDSSIVNLSWIKEGTFGKNSVWILIGWCKYEPKADNCDIFDGHWMTAVGYGKDRSGHLDPSILVLHDSAERAERKNYYARIEVLSHGRIDGSRSARDVLTLTGDVVLKPTADRGLIQGAYRLEF